MQLSPPIERTASVLGHSRYVRTALTRFVDGVSFDVDPSARIARGCLFRGDVELGPEVRLSRGCILTGDVSVGRGTNFETNCELVGDVRVGNYCAVARGTILQQPNHDTARASVQRRIYDRLLDAEPPETDDGPIAVKNDIWFGLRSTVLSGVTVGNGAVVGAGSIVTDDVEPYAIVAGVPAERIGWRFPEAVRERLCDLAWWEWDEETIRRRREFFERDVRERLDVPGDAPGDGRHAASVNRN